MCLSMFAVEQASGSCIYKRKSLKDRVESADLVFVGKFKKDLGRVKQGPENSNRHAKFIVLKLFKGSALKEAELFFHDPARAKPSKSEYSTYTECSLSNFPGFEYKYMRDAEHLIFAKSFNGSFYTSLELGSSVVQSRATKEDISELTSESGNEKK